MIAAYRQTRGPILMPSSEYRQLLIAVLHLSNEPGEHSQLASCLIYARAFIEYVCGCVLFQDVTICEIRRKYGAHFPYSL